MTPFSRALRSRAHDSAPSTSHDGRSSAGRAKSWQAGSKRFAELDDEMKLRVGYELKYAFPQPTPAILMLNIHFTRVAGARRARPRHHQACRADLRLPRRLRQLVLPDRRAEGKVTISTDAVVTDTESPIRSSPTRRRFRSRICPKRRSSFCSPAVLRERSASRSGLEAVRQRQAGLGPRSSHLRLRS